MADEQQLAVLRQGSDAWNAWRQQNPDLQPDLAAAKFTFANLRGAVLYRADLRGADLFSATLETADLEHADLSNAELVCTDLTLANLTSADLTRATLARADLTSAKLSGANFTGAKLVLNVFANVDLSRTKGLETCVHVGPSTIDFRTLERSRQLPRRFLRGCGLPENLIDYLPSLLNQPIQFYSCFISYSSKDDEFARRLHADLQDRGIRCWFAPEDMKIGERIRTTIDEIIHVHEKLLLVLSESSINSDWVEKEVETAFEKERDTKSPVLFPVRLDEAVMESKTGWAADIKRAHRIGDFRRWKEHDAYSKAFERLLRDLKVDQERPNT